MTEERARVGIIPPPVVAIALFLIGVALHLNSPAPFLESESMGLAIGLVFLIPGIILNVIAIRTLRRAQTDVLFRRPVSQIVRKGPYGWSRNPIYLSGVLEFIGLTFIVNSLWLIPVFVLLILYMRVWLIAREERYLSKRFGAEFDAYRSQVRRWV